MVRFDMPFEPGLEIQTLEMPMPGLEVAELSKPRKVWAFLAYSTVCLAGLAIILAATSKTDPLFALSFVTQLQLFALLPLMNIYTAQELVKYCKVLFHLSFLQIPRISFYKLDSTAENRKVLLSSDLVSMDAKMLYGRYADLSLGSKYSVQNLGTTLVIYLAIILALLILMVLVPCRQETSNGKKARFIKRAWTLALAVFLGTYLHSLLALFASLPFIANRNVLAKVLSGASSRRSNGYERFDHAFAIIMLIGLLLACLVSFCYNSLIRARQASESQLNKVSGPWRNQLWVPSFMLRRILAAASIVYLKTHLWHQVAFSVLMSMAYSVYLLKTSPFHNPA